MSYARRGPFDFIPEAQHKLLNENNISLAVCCFSSWIAPIMRLRDNFRKYKRKAAGEAAFGMFLSSGRACSRAIAQDFFFLNFFSDPWGPKAPS